MRWKGILFVLLVTLGAACGSGSTSDLAEFTTVAADTFDQSCAVDGDCVGVEAGDVCSFGCCSVDNAAINGGALTAFEARSREAAGLCPPRRQACNADCVEVPVKPTCVAGKCTLGT